MCFLVELLSSFESVQYLVLVRDANQLPDIPILSFNFYSGILVGASDAVWYVSCLTE